MISYLYDDDARLVRVREDGVETSTRPYSAAENAAADAARAARTIDGNRENLVAKARAAIASNTTFLGLASPTNAQTLAQVRSLTRQMTAMIRIVGEDLASTDGT